MQCVIVYGTRPEAIKLAPVARELVALGHGVTVVNSGQHDALMPTVMKVFGVVPDVELNVLKPGQSLSSLTASLLTNLEAVFERVLPECVIVQGDTATATAAALAAYYAGVPVAHVEAGLRTYCLSSPFPEEADRRIISTVATWNFCPTEDAAQNLRAERAPGRVYVTGNTVVDTLLRTLTVARQPRPAYPFRILATIHRRENIPYLPHIFDAFKRIAERRDVEFMLLVHPNPAVTTAAWHWLGNSRVRLLEPMDYVPWIGLLSSAHLVITDSGGLQEEAPVLGVPLLIVRTETERPEVVRGGYAYLVGIQTENIVSFANLALAGQLEFRQGSPYGDGHAAEHIASILDNNEGYRKTVHQHVKELP